jgi:hypothetical protein
MARRRCGYCTGELGRVASLLRFYACKHCAYRMSMGTSPARPPDSALPVPDPVERGPAHDPPPNPS